MTSGPTTGTRGPLIAVLAVLATLGLAEAAGRLVGLVLLLGVVVATVGALAVGIVLLRALLLH